jgi:hypothetical protein
MECATKGLPRKWSSLLKETLPPLAVTIAGFIINEILEESSLFLERRGAYESGL